MKWTIKYRKDDVVVSNEAGLREVYKPGEMPLFLPTHPIYDTVEIAGELEYWPDSEKLRKLCHDAALLRSRKLSDALAKAVVSGVGR